MAAAPAPASPPAGEEDPDFKMAEDWDFFAGFRDRFLGGRDDRYAEVMRQRQAVFRALRRDGALPSIVRLRKAVSMAPGAFCPGFLEWASRVEIRRRFRVVWAEAGGPTWDPVDGHA